MELFVENCQSQSGLVLHGVKVKNLAQDTACATISVGDRVKVSIDNVRRTNLMRNHTATHVMNYFMR